MSLKWRIKGLHAKFVLRKAIRKGHLPKNAKKYYRALKKARMDIK